MGDVQNVVTRPNFIFAPFVYFIREMNKRPPLHHFMN